MGSNQFNWGCIIKHRILVVLALMACDPLLYDKVYIGIVKQALNTKVTRKDMEVRNRAIETLRKLCKGQVSSYEKH